MPFAPSNRTITAPSGASVIKFGRNTPAAAPVAEFIGAPVSGTAPLAVTFTDQSTGIVSSWAWDFGDGQTSTSQNPTHVYAAAGTYTVALTVTGPGGSNTRTRSSYVSASAAPSGGTIASLTLTADATGAYPYCVGHAFAPGDLPAGTALSGVQMTVKSTWPDGSAKIAVLAGTRSLTGGVGATLDLAAGTAPTGPAITAAALRATGIAAAFDAGVYGSAAWAAGSADWESPFLAWVSGPVMSSWIFRKPFSSDAHLTAWMEVRMWSTGDVEVLPWIENGYLNVASPGDRPETYTFDLDGVERFSAALPVWHHTRAPLISGATLSYWRGATDKTVWAKHDSAYMAQTGLVQRYVAGAFKSSIPAFPTGDNRGAKGTFEPYQTISPTNSNHSSAMGQPGGHASIAVQPVWEAIALTVNSRLGTEQCLRESYLFGYYHVHYRDEATNRPLRFTQHPTTKFSATPSDAVIGFKDVQAGAGTAVAYPASLPSGGMRWLPSHQPAAPLLAYLMTGRFWFVEECQFIATANYLSIQPAWRGNSSALALPNGQQMRSAAWMARNLFIAACVTPDDDALHPDFEAAVDANIDHCHGRQSNPLGMFETGARYWDGVTESIGGAQAWQYDFWTGAWGRLMAFRLGSTAAARQKARQFFDWTSRSVVGRIGTTASTDFLYRFATTQAAGGSRVPFVWPGSGISMDVTGTTVSGTYPDYAGGTGPWFSDWGAIYTALIEGQDGYSGGKVDGALGGGFWLDLDGWWGNMMGAIAVCAALDAPGARAAMARLTSASNWGDWLSAISGTTARMTNGLDYYALPVESFGIPTAGQRLNINLNNASDVDYDLQVSGAGPYDEWWNGYGTYRSFTQMVSAWSGGIDAPGYGVAGAAVVFGGGHGANQGMFAYLFDRYTRTWKQVGAPRNLPATVAWSGWEFGYVPNNYNPAIDLRDQDWYDYDHNGSRIILIDHTYNTIVYIGPEDGGGPDGSLLIPTAAKTQEPSQGAKFSPRLLSLTDGTMTRALATAPNTAAVTDKLNTLHDTTRKRVWYLRQGSSTAHYLDYSSGFPGTWGTHTLRDEANAIYTAFPEKREISFCPDADAAIMFSVPDALTTDATLSIVIFDMSTGVPVKLNRTLPTTTIKHGGQWLAAPWCSPQQAFYLYEGMGDTFCTVLRPSSLDFSTATFAWSRESFSGPTPPARNTPVGAAAADAWGAFRRFVWDANVGCFEWHDGPLPTGVVDGTNRDGIVQLWRPPGAVI